MYICNLASFLHASLGCPVTRAAPFGVPNVLRRVAARIAAEIAARITASKNFFRFSISDQKFVWIFNFGSNFGARVNNFDKKNVVE